MNEPTLAEIVTGLRSDADSWEKLPEIFGNKIDAEKMKRVNLLRAAADRLEGLAKLAGSVTIDALDEMTVEHHESVDDWFAERDRLMK